uniref:Uncharacterized protein n=1 Tax=Arundo donax TaxID=35708 RepID=A0A0A9GGF4_ARUDO
MIWWERELVSFSAVSPTCLCSSQMLIRCLRCWLSLAISSCNFSTMVPFSGSSNKRRGPVSGRRRSFTISL